MKKFNVKLLSMAIAAAVASGAAGAAVTDADVELAQKVAKQAALAAIENALELNGFKAGDGIVETKGNGSKAIRTATQGDVDDDDFGGLGLKEVVAQHDRSFYELNETVNENSEALVKTAEVVNTISANVTDNTKKIDGLMTGLQLAAEAVEDNRKDIDANTAAIKTKADKADFEELAKYTADMGKKVNDIGDEVTALSDATSAAITRHDKDIVDLAQAGLKATEALEANRKDIDANKKYIGDLALAGKAAADALEANRQDIDANKAAIAENTAALEEQKEANEGFNNAIASLDKDIGDLALAGKAAADALEANRQDIDANKAAIAENTAKLEEQKEANEGFNNAIASLDKDIGDLALAGKAAADALEANRKDIDDNKQGIVDLAKGLGLAAEAVEDNRKEIDANKAAIDKKADKADIETAKNAAVEAEKSAKSVQGSVEVAEKSAKAAAGSAQAAQKAADANAAQVAANKAAIAENTAKLEEQKEANEGFNNAIASLDKDIGDLALAGKAAADALEANRQDIDANKAAVETKADKTAVESVRTIAVEAQKSAQAAKGAVEVAQKSAENADSHAKAAQTAAAKAQESADTNAVQIVANTKQINTNKTDIAALQTANGQHAAGIAKNSARIDSLDRDVANLRKETRQGLAAQAALSGLFQPYSVGKFNATAALGGFKSDTAVAVGAGYRFNENFAAKAGLAVSTSSGDSVSYNVGVNYEW